MTVSDRQRHSIPTLGQYLRRAFALLGLIAAGSAYALPQNGTWSVGSAFSPKNRHGHNPIYSSLPRRAKGHRLNQVDHAEAAGSSNYVLTIPIFNLPGRGIDLNLALVYNSQIWQDGGGGVIEWDPDVGWPVAGWSLGFGKIARIESSSSVAMIVDADGTRHPFAGTNSFTTGNNEFTAHTVDGSLIDYVVNMGPLLSDGMKDARASYPDGTIVIYGAPGEVGTPNVGAIYPTRITDAHGNFISIAYRNGRGPMIDAITDTLGRVVVFHYDSSGRLVSIVRPGLNNSQLTAIRLHYGFQNRLDAIFFPTDSSGYWFGATDSYTSYGIIETVRHQRSMSMNVPSLDDQGSVAGSGTNSYTQKFNYPLTVALTNDGTLPFVPKYTTVTEQWSDMDTPPAVTTYAVSLSGSGQTITISAPDKTVTTVYEDAGGLVSRQQIAQQDGSLLSRTDYTWEIGDYGSPRVKRIESRDERAQVTAQEFSYGPTNQVTEEREFAYGGTHVQRRTTTDYVSDPRYVARHIFNLPSAREVFDDVKLQPAARSEYQYDTESLMDAPGVVQFDAAYNPYSGAFLGANAARGDLTRITRYASAAGPSGPLTEVHGYDIAGNVRTVTGTACCELISSTYAVATQYAYPSVLTTGAASGASTVHRTVQYGRDFGTGLLISITEPSGRWQELQYSPTSLRIEHVLQKSPGGASFDFEVDTTYDDADLTSTETTSDANHLVAKQMTVSRNGVGQVRRVQSFPDTGIVDITDAKYDAKKRAWQISRAYRSGFVPQWTRIAYDGLDRVISETGPDGSVTSTTINSPQRPGDASNEAGKTEYTVDAWGRGRWTRSDALGRLVEVLEPNPNGDGTVYSPEAIVTRYSYDALDDLVAIDHVQQHAEFAFDSLGRLVGQRLPERERTLTAAGDFSRAYGLYSDVYAYDERGSLASHTDARGIKTTYDNINDPLGRLGQIHFDLSGFGDTANPIAGTDDVAFAYSADGDPARLESASTVGSTFSLSYNDKSLPESAVTVLTALPDYPLSVGYLYDSFDRRIDTIYPSEYGFPSSLSSGKRFYPHNVVHVDYDAGSRMKHLTVDGVDYASGVSYDAAAQLIALNTGSASSLLGESYDIDELTGLLNAQHVAAPGVTLLSLSYQYTRSGAGGRSGQATQMVDQLGAQRSQAYDFDALGRLRQVTFGNAASVPATYWTQRYEYDAYGNRIHTKAFGAPPLFHCMAGKKCVPPPAPELGADQRDGIDGITYDPETNHISTPGYSYDAAGNLVRSQAADGTWRRFQYDAAGRLARITNDGGAPIEQEIYGAGTQRLARIVGGGSVSGGQSTLYAWSGNQVIAEFTADPASLGDKIKWGKSFVYFGDRLLASLDVGASTVPLKLSQAATFYHPGRLGTRLTTDSAGKVLSTNNLYAFGVAPAGSSATADSRMFASYDRSQSTGLDYAVNRYYVPSLGRFLQTDPLGLASAVLTNPQSLNFATYVGNDPGNKRDPLGLDDESAPKPCVAIGMLPDGTKEYDCQTTVTGQRYWSLPTPGYDSWNSGGTDGGGGGGNPGKSKTGGCRAYPAGNNFTLTSAAAAAFGYGPMADVTGKENVHSDQGDHGHAANDDFISWATSSGNFIIVGALTAVYPYQTASFGIGFAGGKALEKDMLPDFSVPSVDRVVVSSYLSMGGAMFPALMGNLIQETWHRDDLTPPSYPVPCSSK